MGIKLTQSLKVFSLLMFCLLFVNMASAVLETKSFNPNVENFGEIKINDWYGLSNKADYRLGDFDASVINVWAEGTTHLHQTTHLFTGIHFKNLLGQSGEFRETKFFIWTNESYEQEIPIYEESCHEVFNETNQTEICESIQTGSTTETKYKTYWKPYQEGEEYPEGDYLWRFEAKRKANQPVDFVLEAHGKTFDEWAWLNSSFQYRKPIDVQENSGSSLNNYSTLIYVTYDADMNSDFSDLRFSNEAGTEELGYWIENKSDSNYAYVWVKIPTLTASSETTIYMYFGYASATTQSDKNDAFWLSFSETRTQSITTNTWTNYTTQDVYFSGPWKYKTISSQVAHPNGATSGYFKWGVPGANSDLLSIGNTGCSGFQWNSVTYCRVSGIGATTYSTTNLQSPNSINGLYFLQYQLFTDTGGQISTVYDVEMTIMGYASSEPTYSIGAKELSNLLEINSISPEDYFNSSSSIVSFSGNGTDETGLYQLNLTINGTVYETVSGDGSTNLTLSSNETISDGFYEWYLTGNDDTETRNSTARSLLIDSTNPILSSAYNLTDLITLTLPINSTWHFNATDKNLDKCYYNTSDDATLQIITCNSTQTTNWTTQGSKTIQFCANDTFSHETCNTTSLDIYLIDYDQDADPRTVAESFDVTFNLTVNMTSIPTTTANLTLNNTIYSPTTIEAGSDGYYFEITIEIPDGWGNATGITQDWVWNYTIEGVANDQDTATDNITVYELAIDDCSSYGDVILNFSLNDEETNTLVNESAGANVEIDLTLTSKTNSAITLTYSNTWTNENNPQVCLPNNVLNNSQYWIDFTVGFSSTNRVWEFYYLDDGTLNSTKVFNGQTDYTIDLMDLLTDDSTSFLFNYFDQDGLPVTDAMVYVYRKYIGEGTFREVERAKADLNGDTIVHLVEEDVIYYFLITQYGEVLFTSSTYTALCQATPCTIQIEASGGSATFPTDWDLVDGGAYEISSSASTREVNLTFTTDETSTFNLTVYKYNSDGSYSPINSSTSTGTSGSILMTVPQSAGNVSFFASVVKDDVFVNSEWVDFEGKAQDRFGVTLALFIGALIILSLGLMAVTEGVGTLVFVILGVALSGFLGLVTTELSTGVNVVVYLVIAGGILLWKLTGGRR